MEAAVSGSGNPKNRRISLRSIQAANPDIVILKMEVFPWDQFKPLIQ